MILADATPEATTDAAHSLIEEHEAIDGSATFLVSMNGLPVAAYMLTPAHMSIELPLIAVRKEMRRKGIGTIVMQDALRRAGQRPLVLETPEAIMPFFTTLGFKKFGRRTGPDGSWRFRLGWHTPGQRNATGE
jgi:GNAT superfamily N-acetyltransferase